MAHRRMFSNRIANSARFLQMPVESQLLYFHMVLRADDDGIVESYPLMKLLGVASDNFKVLLAKKFIRELNEDQVIVITDWLEHNTIRADRKVDSIYKSLLLEKFPETPVIAPKPRSDVEDNSKRVRGPSMVSISKDRLGKVKLSKDKLINDFARFWEAYPRKTGKKTAEKVWMKLSPSPELIEKILDSLEAHKKSPQWTKDGNQFVPHPTTFLNQERWNDEVLQEESVKHFIIPKPKL